MLAHVKGRAPCLLLIKLGLLSQNWQLSLYHFMNQAAHIATHNQRNRLIRPPLRRNDVREEVFKKKWIYIMQTFTLHISSRECTA